MNYYKQFQKQKVKLATDLMKAKTSANFNKIISSLEKLSSNHEAISLKNQAQKGKQRTQEKCNFHDRVRRLRNSPKVNNFNARVRLLQNKPNFRQSINRNIALQSLKS